MDAEILLFIEYLAVERKYSTHTVTAYHKDLQQFQQYLAESPNTNLPNRNRNPPQITEISAKLNPK